jgi:hypothetical protein
VRGIHTLCLLFARCRNLQAGAVAVTWVGTGAHLDPRQRDGWATCPHHTWLAGQYYNHIAPLCCRWPAQCRSTRVPESCSCLHRRPIWAHANERNTEHSSCLPACPRIEYAPLCSSQQILFFFNAHKCRDLKRARGCGPYSTIPAGALAACLPTRPGLVARLPRFLLYHTAYAGHAPAPAPPCALFVPACPLDGGRRARQISPKPPWGK